MSRKRKVHFANPYHAAGTLCLCGQELGECVPFLEDVTCKSCLNSELSMVRKDLRIARRKMEELEEIEKRYLKRIDSLDERPNILK